MSEQYKLPYKIEEKYSREIADIKWLLDKMENGRIYGVNGNYSKMDGSLATNCQQLRKQFSGLLNKIQNGSDSTEDNIKNVFNKYSDNL